MEEKRILSALTVYRERGAYLRRLEQFDKSKAAYDEAFNSVPDGADLRTLTGRSQVCGDAVQPAQAYQDAALALQLAPNNLHARNMQARARYTMCDFEQSLVINHRGSRHRTNPAYFREGINQGLETMQDCLGENAGTVMVDLLPLIKQEEATRRDEHEPIGPLHVSRIPKHKSKRQLTQMEARRHALLSRVMAMKYLGPMAYDKFFLQDIKNDPCLDSANTGGSAQLKKAIDDTLNTLCVRQEILRAAQPYYTIKNAEKCVSKYQTKYKKEVLTKERQSNTRTAERLLKQIENNLRSNRVKDVIYQAEHMQQFLDKKTLRNLPEKDYYLDRLYRNVGEAYLSQHRLSYTLSERANKRRIAFLMGLPVRRAQSYDSVMANYPYKFIDVKRATQNLLATLEMCENSMMRCWLMYELARLLCLQKNFTLGKFYAKRCQREAQNIESVTWWLNGCFVLLSSDMQQGNTNDVKVLVEEAHEWAKHIGDSERLQSFLSKCVEVVSETAAVDERMARIKRQKDIQKIMPEEQKADLNVLFENISQVPPGRQFSVLPGKGPGSTRSERHHRCQQGLSVVPGPEKPLPAPPHSKTLGFQIFDI